MEKDFKIIVKEKSKDDLIRIVVNRDEYKDELVTAAEAELRLRDKERNFAPTEKVSFNHEVPKKQETPFGIYLAGIILFLTGPIWLFIGSLQAGAAAVFDSSIIGMLSIWNIFIAVLSIVFGIGILKGVKWGYDWGLGTAMVNFVWFGYLFFSTESMLFAFFAFLEFVVAFALLANKDYFFINTANLQNLALALNNDIVIEMSEEEEKVYKEKVVHLNNLIQSGKKSLFGSSNKPEIIKLAEELCSTKENADYLLKVYGQLFASDLIDDLKQLTTSYSGIKEYCQVFINHEIVKNDYPHERLT